LDTMLLDVDQYIDRQDINNAAIKEFAALVVPFQEIILCDADAVFIQNPDLLFEDEEYKKEHAIFFRDRSVFPGFYGKKNWIIENIPQPYSPNLLNNRMYRALTEHEQDSGVVVINKRERLGGVLSACHLVSTSTREYYYKEFYRSEKEAWWIGFELAGQSYTFLHNGTGSGVYGEARDLGGGKFDCCGHMASFDRQGNPLWVNGAFRGDSQYKKYTHYSYDGDWDFVPRCTPIHVTPLNAQQLAAIDGISKLWLADPLVGTHHLDPNIYKYLNLKKKHKQQLRKLTKRKRKVVQSN